MYSGHVVWLCVFFSLFDFQELCVLVDGVYAGVMWCLHALVCL